MMDKIRELCTEMVSLGEEFWYNALPVGQFHDPRYGKISVTPTLVNQLAKSYGKATSYTPPVKLGHGDGAPSPGVIKEARAEIDGLHIRVDVDDATAKDIRDKRYRYMSVEYHPSYVDKETGSKIGPALLGVALTNQPGHPGVSPIVLSDDGWVQRKENDGVDKMQELEMKLAEMEKERVALEEAKAAAETKLAEETAAKEKAVQMADSLGREVAEAKAAKREAEVQAFCDKAIAEGVPPAVVDKVRPVLLSESDGIIKLGDNKEVQMGVFLTELLETIPKVPMGALGDPAAREDRAVVLGDQIAGYANGVPVKK